MNIQITADLYEQLEMIVENDGDRITLRRRTRNRVGEAWGDWKFPILNRRESLAVYQGISNAILNRRKYVY